MATQNAAVAGNVCAIILAAGRGSRLKHHTECLPKCLMEVAGQTILSRMLDELERQGICEFIIAVGYQADQIRDYVNRFHGNLAVTFVENPEFLLTGSVFSLALALDRVPDHYDVLIVEGDVVLEPGLGQNVLKPLGVGCEAATLLAAYKPEFSGTFALVEEGRVTSWVHESRRGPDFPLPLSYKTVNLTALGRGEPVRRLLAAVRTTIIDAGRMAPLEYAMQLLLGNGLNIAAAMVGAARWYEVDTPEELVIANGLFAFAPAKKPQEKAIV